MKGQPPLKGEGDRYLIASIRKGDEAAYRQLLDRYSGRLSAYAARRLAGTGLDAEDAVQETFLGLVQSLDRLEAVRSLEAYLFQILRHKIADLAAKRPEAHGLKRVPLAGEESREGAASYEPIAPGGTPSSYARREEAAEVRHQVLADILAEAIQRLKDEKNFRDLKILELLFFAQRPNREITALVGTSEPTVTRAKAAALERLSRLARQHPRMDPALDFFEDEEKVSGLIRAAWRDNLLSCLKRSTLGASLLGTLEPEWADYVAFHLDVAGCDICAANLADLKSESASIQPAARERLFASSVGFVRRRRRG
ncbi:MAG: sigma-70 family RNA polymerase sigma factor [Planctomycetes bacterium]|nr:sigma-70 family RNA polymerase sigma factor [Planctomycetota bacterium]